ncbi:SDR family oxidoreductase [Flavobacterium tyrosinilyticum]|uniref:SDR family oxidoreductase n=1 Tax=Flavobacterium tyrosinilyticum TaxID=1658740 RepID=UPI00202EB523|nr:SDR family NAD(P)-dependent oxidoreductase [Flavobacterium tyrosinilyticum]MCM0667652.1 SDR family NAD(P)-dependent oxidoreductase [Flavobacterium tyrosinilyticum]
MNIQNKTILITGGASGIGLEAARQFLDAGARVIITGRNQSKLDEVSKRYPLIKAIQSDAADETDAKNLYDEIVALGGIDILYHNAGVGVPPANLGIPDKKHLQGAVYEMDVNYFGVIRLNNLFMSMLKSRSEAAIIHTTSILSIVPSAAEATYSSSKAALAFYTVSLRRHLQVINSKVKVFELLPPLVDTEMVAGRDDKKISPKELVEGLIKGIKKNTLTIRVGDSKAVYLINRLFPNLAYGLVNKKKADRLLLP